jgi:molecular chaperone DnaJ
MNVHEACHILGVPIGSSELDVKTAFKKKAIQYHPDRNKDPNAEVKFKEINSAFQFLEKHGANPPAYNDVSSNFYSSSDHLAEEIRRQMDEVFNKVHVNNGSMSLVVNLEISFETAIFGGVIEIKYPRIVKCDVCKDGKAKVACPKCNGSGKRKYGSGAVQATNDRELPCNGCTGTGVAGAGVCTVCQGTSKKKHIETIPVTIKPGTVNGSRVQMKGFGNYLIRDMYGDLILTINVKANADGLTLSGEDVISVVEISLLEALKGTKKSLRTIKGDKVLEFKPKIRNGDRIRVSGFGVPPNGAHIFVVNVTYPEDVSEVIEALEKKEPPPPEPDQFGCYPKD